MKRSFLIIGIILALCLCVCITIYLFTFGPLNPATMDLNQKRADAKKYLTEACSNTEINETLRKNYVCKLIPMVDGCNNKDASYCDDGIVTPNMIEPKLIEFGNGNKMQLFARGADGCFGPCGGDGGEFENFAVSYGNNIIGYLRIFTDEKNTDQVAWKQVGDNIYFYLYDGNAIRFNTKGSNVVFKYNIQTNQFFASQITTIIPNEKYDSASFDNSINLVLQAGSDTVVLTPTNFVLQDPNNSSTGGLINGYLSNSDSYTSNK